MVTLLFPGRHHLLTDFQYSYLRELIQNGFKGKKVTKIIFAITSGDHANTRRNPIPLYLRVLAIEKFSKELPCETKIYPISDVKQTEKFAEYLLHQIEYQSGEKLNNKNCFLACSTPNVIKMFRKLGYKTATVELVDEKNERYSTLRPYEIINLLVKSGKNWKKDNSWKKYTSSATEDVYLEYNLGDLIIELFRDSLLNEDADITSTRDYSSYGKSMDQNVEFKFKDIRPFVLEGKIVDVGCGTGGLVWHLSKNFEESDIIGIEATRTFYEYCKLQKYPNPFVYFYRKNILDQVFSDRTVNTFIYSSVFHEVYSYMGVGSLKKIIRNSRRQLVSGGRIIIRDVVGPKNKAQVVYLRLNDLGKSSGDVKEMSIYHRFFKFVQDFKLRKIKYELIKDPSSGKNLIKTTMQNAYEFISKMHYTDNWKSEMREEFGYWSFDDWKNFLEKEGFDVVEGSKEFKSDYIVDKMYSNFVEIYKREGKNFVKVDYPPTNLILAAQKRDIR